MYKITATALAGTGGISFLDGETLYPGEAIQTEVITVDIWRARSEGMITIIDLNPGGPTTGPQGPQGYQGRQGVQGFRGPQGSQGFSGAQGSSGPQGKAGEDGFQGERGPQGPQGYQGPQGFSGIDGVQGHQGSQGLSGTSGGQGSQGDTGAQGVQGHQGPVGTQGDTGVQGPQGSEGSQGPQGSTGESGGDGAQGFRGVQGSQGHQGSQGVRGYQGVQGVQGVDGAQGFRGLQGTQGGTTLLIYTQLFADMLTFPANMWTDIIWSKSGPTNGILFSGPILNFTEVGVYNVSTSLKLLGQNGWSALRLHDGTRTLGVSAGFGSSESDVDCQPTIAEFMVDIQDLNKNYRLQVGRTYYAARVENPTTVIGESPSAILTTIVKVDRAGTQGPQGHQGFQGEPGYGSNALLLNGKSWRRIISAQYEIGPGQNYSLALIQVPLDRLNLYLWNVSSPTTFVYQASFMADEIIAYLVAGKRNAVGSASFDSLMIRNQTAVAHIVEIEVNSWE